jgi:DNA (cytosine-5)-methyltransferase 1
VTAKWAKGSGGPAGDEAYNLVAFHLTQDPICGDVAPAMGKGNAQGCATVGAMTSTAVRRLTPVECERLMGWPDGWTAPRGVNAPDSRRYAACGDGVVAPVAEWIGRRLAAELDA